MEKPMPKKTTQKKTKRIVKKASKKATKKTVRKAKPVVAVVPQAVAPPPPVVVAAPPLPVRQTVSMPDVIWSEIQNVALQMFGLPGQIVSMHCTPVPIEPSKLYVSIRSQATLPA